MTDDIAAVLYLTQSGGESTNSPEGSTRAKFQPQRYPARAIAVAYFTAVLGGSGGT